MQPEADGANYERAYRREKRARQKAEDLLERRSRELYSATQQIQIENTKLKAAHRELSETQTQLVHSEKMASIGQLAAGIAHEINNPVAFIRSNLNTLANYLESINSLLSGYREVADRLKIGSTQAVESSLETIGTLEDASDFDFLLEDAAELLKESSAGTDRVVEIVNGLKNFARLNEADVKEADVNEGIKSTLKIAWNELKYKAEVRTHYGDVPLLKCNAGELNQVFLNLLINAAQAVGDGGLVTITTHATIDDVIVEIRDNGCGIAQKDLGSIFDPFFTTKDVGKGTGLGLSISHGIVEKHGGKISVESIVGEGTCFAISLPRNPDLEVAA